MRLGPHIAHTPATVTRTTAEPGRRRRTGRYPGHRRPPQAPPSAVSAARAGSALRARGCLCFLFINIPWKCEAPHTAHRTSTAHRSTAHRAPTADSTHSTHGRRNLPRTQRHTRSVAPLPQVGRTSPPSRCGALHCAHLCCTHPLLRTRWSTKKPVSPPCEHFAELSSVRLPSPGVPCMRPVPHRLRLRRADAIIPRRCDARICGRSLIRYMLRAGTCQLRTQVPAQNFTDVRLRGTKPWSHHRHRLLWSCRPWRRPSRA